MLLYRLEHWIDGRTITQHDGRWTHDLSDLYVTRAAAETQRAEFHTESRTRIVLVELIEREVIAEWAAVAPSGRLFW